MKSICVNDSAGSDQLERMNSSCCESASIQVLVTIKSSSATTVCNALARSESIRVQQRSRFWDQLSHVMKVCQSVQAHIDVSTQDRVLSWSPTHEILDFRQNRLEIPQCLFFVRQMG